MGTGRQEAKHVSENTHAAGFGPCTGRWEWKEGGGAVEVVVRGPPRKAAL